MSRTHSIRDTVSPQNDPEARKKPRRRVYAEYGCVTGKRGWRSRKEAKRKLKEAHRIGATMPKGPNDKFPVAVYDCPHCPFWHMTSQQPRTNRRSRAPTLEHERADAESWSHDNNRSTPSPMPDLQSPTSPPVPAKAPRGTGGAKSRRTRRHGHARGR